MPSVVLQATFFADLEDHSEVYSDNVGRLVPKVFPLADSEASQMTFIDSQTPWVAAKREVRCADVWHFP